MGYSGLRFVVATVLDEPVYTYVPVSLTIRTEFNCCLSMHVDNYTIIIPTKCTRCLLLKAQDITICTFLSCILPLHVSTRVGHLHGAQRQCLAKVITDYNLLKLR
jgi:hypothetical protein